MDLLLPTKSDGTIAEVRAGRHDKLRRTMSAWLITHARILDGSGAAPFTGSVRVDDTRITEVTPGDATPDARDARVIDATGATLMPGLVESHAHLGFADIPAQDLTRLPPEEHMLVTVRNAKLMLDCGYTSAFSGAAPKPRLDVVLKARDRRRPRAGPASTRERPGDHGHRRARRHEPAAPALSRVADVLLGRRRPRRDPARVPSVGARGRRPARPSRPRAWAGS